MQTKELVKKPEPAFSRTNNPVNNNQKNKPATNKKNVRTTDYKKLLQIMLNDPDAITRDEFMILQSELGYRQTATIIEETKLYKKQRKLEQTNVGMKPIPFIKPKFESKKDSDGKLGVPELKNNYEKNSLQMMKDDGNTVASSLGMPNNLREGLEKLSGIDLSDLKVHQNSDKPKQVGALAYTQGSDIHIAPGQEKHLPHEGWHAVQQKQGRVKPTLQMKSGERVNADERLEKEADVMGNKAIREMSQNSSAQFKRTSQELVHGEGNVIQRLTIEEGITQVYFGEKSDNVKKIQQVLMKMNYWTGSSDDKPTGYFGDVTKESLVNFQIGYMKLKKQDLYNKKGEYVGCGPKTAQCLNNLYKLLNNSYVPEQAKNGTMMAGKNEDVNAAYTWQIQAGKYNGHVKEAQEMLKKLGYKLPRYGADGKWSGSGETFNSIKTFQNAYKYKYNGVKPTGKLDKATYDALEKEVSKKGNSGKAQEEKPAAKNGSTAINGTEDIFDNPDLWLSNKAIIIDLYTLEAHLESSKGISFWKMSEQQKKILYKGLRMSENTTTPDIMFNRIQAIRTIYDIPEKNELTFIDSATVQGIIKEELQIQAAETWKKRIPLFLRAIKERVKNSHNSYIDYINLSEQEKKVIQYSLKLYQTGDLDADTANAIENLKTKYKIKAIDKYPFALDVATMDVIIELCKKRTDWGNKHEVLSSISDFTEEYRLGELFYSIVVGWVSAPMSSIDDIAVLGSKAKGMSNTWKNADLLDELAKSGVKYNLDDVLAVTKTVNGKLVWLEAGNSKAGMQHILNHADDFAKKGIQQNQIKDLVMESLTNGKIVGYQGRGTGRPIYEVKLGGKTYYTAITVSDNGFIVGANPTTWQ